MRTKLPKEWCIKDTPEAHPTLEKWRTNKGFTLGGYLMYPGYQNVIGYWSSENFNNFPEITFEEFKHFVLNQPVKPVKKENYKYLTTFLRKLNIT